MAEAFDHEIATLYEAREQEHEARRLQSSLSPRRGPRLSNLSLERFRSSTKYQDRPAAADIAFCVAAFANGMTEDRIGCALEERHHDRRFCHRRRAQPGDEARAGYLSRLPPALPPYHDDDDGSAVGRGPLGQGIGGEARRPLGIAVVGGLMLSQTVTLYVTPVIYLYLHRLRRIRGQKANDSEAVPSTEALGVS
jgi:hypothetical protein